MSRKKIVTIVVTVLSVVSLFGIFTVNAAGNYEDTSYYFLFENMEAKYTEPRLKTDDTSSYIKCTYCTGGRSFTASVYGMKSIDIRDGRYDCSGGHSYKIENGTTCKLVNYVKEGGYAYGCIQGKPSAIISTRYDSYGVWSPDSK